MKRLSLFIFFVFCTLSLLAEGPKLQAKRDSDSKKYGYENVGEKQYWWAEAHKLGKGKEELNSALTTQWVISPQYDKVSKNFSEGLAAVEIDGKVGFIDELNRFVIEPVFEQMDDLEGFHLGMAVVKKDGKYGFIDKRGNFVFQPGFEKAENFGNDLLAVIKDNGKFGAIDLAGDTVVPCTYIAKEIMTTVPVKNKPYKTAQKEAKGKLEQGYYDNLLADVVSSEEYGDSLIADLDFLPVSGNQPAPAQGSVTPLSDGYYLWTDGTRKGVIDSYGRTIIPPIYKLVEYQPEESLFIVQRDVTLDGRPAFGIVNRSGGWVIPPVFETLSNFENGLARASIGDCNTLVDENGLVESYFIEDMLKKSSEERGTYYTQRLIGVWPTCAPAHNNMGIYYASSCDDLKHAINHFVVAHRLDPDNEDFKANMKAAKSERNGRRWNRVLTGLQIAGAVLTIGAMTYSAVSGNTVMPTSDFAMSNSTSYGGDSFSGHSSGYDSGSAQGSDGSHRRQSEAYYKEFYQKFESSAKSIYETLTSSGTRSQRNGKASSGTTEGSWQGGNYVMAKRELRKAQDEMRKLRRRALKDGYNLPKSEYEDVTVTIH